MPTSKVLGMLTMLTVYMHLIKKPVLVVRIIGGGGGLKNSGQFST
jgi:hypothetical protein